MYITPTPKLVSKYLLMVVVLSPKNVWSKKLSYASNPRFLAARTLNTQNAMKFLELFLKIIPCLLHVIQKIIAQLTVFNGILRKSSQMIGILSKNLGD